MTLSANAVIQRRGLMFVLSSPSGAGKSTISRALLDRHENLAMSISCTTRSPRPGEVDGHHYFFIDEDRYHQMVKESGFLEHAKVFDNYYGTPREPVERALSAGHDILFDIDWQGTQQVRENAEQDLVSVFILPPTIEELERRLHARAQDSDAVIAKRMAKAMDEMSHYAEYDYIVVNVDLEESIREVESILTAERLKRERQVGLASFVNRMRAEEQAKEG